MSRRAWALALAVLAFALVPTWVAARPVPIGRHVEVAFGLAPDHPWPTQAGSRRRANDSPFVAPSRAPRRVFDVNVGGGRLFAPAIDRRGRLWIGAGAGLTVFDARGAVLSRAELGLASGTPSLTPEGDVAVFFRGHWLRRVNAEGVASEPVELSQGVVPSPLILDDGSVVVADRLGSVQRLDQGLHAMRRVSLVGDPRTPPALAPDGTILVAAGATVVRLDQTLHPLARHPLAARVVAGPAVGPDSSVWVITSAAQLVHLDGELNVIGTQRLSERRLAAPGLAVAPDGSARVSALGYGLAGFAPDLSPLFALPGLELARGLAVDREGTVLILDERRELRAVAPDGTVRWSVPVGVLPWAPPIVGADSTLYLVGRRGRLAAWR